jgi:predicted CoA-substrate-specific enzyme activase
MVVDIGGQDSKVILVDVAGKASEFLTNDKCAAGTGRFLETMAHALELQVDEMAHLGHDTDPAQVNSTCTVFAESEIVGLLAAEVKRDAIIAGINKAVAERTYSLANRLGIRSKIIFCGGVAKNSGVRKALERALKQSVIVPAEPQLVGALGAAILAFDSCV